MDANQLNNPAIPILGRKKDPCKHCGRPKHPFTTKCSYSDLLKRIEVLVEANSLIPAVMEANKGAIAEAENFRNMARNAGMALHIREKAVIEFENGPQIWKRFQERLEAEWPKATSQGTEESQKTSSQESTTQSESEGKNSTEETTTGGTTAPDSSQQIQSATPAESPQQ